MERHHLPTHCVAGICDLVASPRVQQEEKIKTAGLETSDPLEEEPARCQRSDKKDCRQDASGPIRGKPWNATILVASADVQQEEKIKTAGRMPAVR